MDYPLFINTPALGLIAENDHKFSAQTVFMMAVTAVMVTAAVMAIPVVMMVFAVGLLVKTAPMVRARPKNGFTTVTRAA